MVALYLSGLRHDDSAKELGLHPATLCNILNRRNIPRRSASASQRHRRAFSFNERYFQSITTEEQAYFLGFIAADGCVWPEDNLLSILLARTDKDHLQRLAHLLGPDVPVRDRSYKAPDGSRRLTARLAVRSPLLLADLAACNIVPRKSLTAVPWAGPDDLMPHYWRGVFDGDGCLHRRANGYWSTSLVGSQSMVNGFCEFVAKHVGWMGQAKQVKGKGREYGFYQAGYGGLGLPARIAHLLYGSCAIALDRKLALARQLMEAGPDRPFGQSREKRRFL